MANQIDIEEVTTAHITARNAHEYTLWYAKPCGTGYILSGIPLGSVGEERFVRPVNSDQIKVFKTLDAVRAWLIQHVEPAGTGRFRVEL